MNEQESNRRREIEFAYYIEGKSIEFSVKHCDDNYWEDAHTHTKLIGFKWDMFDYRIKSTNNKSLFSCDYRDIIQDAHADGKSIQYRTRINNGIKELWYDMPKLTHTFNWDIFEYRFKPDNNKGIDERTELDRLRIEHAYYVNNKEIQFKSIWMVISGWRDVKSPNFHWDKHNYHIKPSSNDDTKFDLIHHINCMRGSLDPRLFNILNTIANKLDK